MYLHVYMEPKLMEIWRAWGKDEDELNPFFGGLIKNELKL